MKKHSTMLAALILLLAAPLAGGLVRGLPPEFFRFPPLLEAPPAAEMTFSWLAFLTFSLLFGLALGVYCWPESFGFRSNTPERTPDPSPAKTRPLPKRGVRATASLVLFWCLAWGRFPWLGRLNDFMFFPLWMSYILAIDALVQKRTGRSLWSRQRAGFVWLFPLSALFWWYYEYLNRFVQNWSYQGMDDFGTLHYVVYSSLCFSTVLPALFETADLILSFRHVRESFAAGPRWKPGDETLAFGCACAGLVGLFLIGLLPRQFFWLVWLAPPLIAAGLMNLGQMRSPLSRLPAGDHALLAAMALAALLCGLLWELWNAHAMPHWIYHIPLVSRFHIFEMPLPGYSGYLPFGIAAWIGWFAMLYLLPDSFARPGWRLTAYLEEAARVPKTTRTTEKSPEKHTEQRTAPVTPAVADRGGQTPQKNARPKKRIPLYCL